MLLEGRQALSSPLMRQIDSRGRAFPSPLYTWLGNVTFLHHHMHVIWRHLPQTATDRVDERWARCSFQVPARNQKLEKQTSSSSLPVLRKAQP